MPALDFPASPTNGQQFTGPGGVIWVYDSTKTAWVSGSLTTAAYNPMYGNVGRNYIHNAAFTVAQRTLPVTATGYTLDRWRAEVVTDAVSFSQAALADADRAAIGDEEAISALQNVVTTGSAAAGAYNMVHQRIETPRRLAGDTVTVSFWAKASTGTPKLGISIDQVWNSVATNGTGVAVTLATTWARYSATIVIPSGSGKTQVGTDYTQLNLWFSSGATNNTRAGSIGVQAGPFTVQIWGVQLELGPTATALEKLDPVTQLQQCQRFYQTGGAYLQGYAVAAVVVQTTIPLSTTMRATPAIVPTWTTQTNCGSSTSAAALPGTVVANTTVTATGQFVLQGTFTASADL